MIIARGLNIQKTVAFKTEIIGYIVPADYLAMQIYLTLPCMGKSSENIPKLDNSKLGSTQQQKIC